MQPGGRNHLTRRTLLSTAAALIFPSQFFSTLSPASATLASFATLGVGFLARPVGGILWGHFGDRIGRKGMLVASLFFPSRRAVTQPQSAAMPS